MQWMAFVWLALIIVFLALETTTVSLISIWFALGSLAAMIASLFSAPLWVQGLLFLAVSCGTLALFRPLFRRFIKPKIVPTNIDSVIGSTGLVTEEINNMESKGQVKLGAMVWTARSSSGETVPEGTLIRVDRIEGVKVFVSHAEVSVK